MHVSKIEIVFIHNDIINDSRQLTNARQKYIINGQLRTYFGFYHILLVSTIHFLLYFIKILSCYKYAQVNTQGILMKTKNFFKKMYAYVNRWISN